MYVSPKKATFKKSMRGYKARQVDAYIETLCSDFVHAEEDYQARIAELEEQIAQAEARIDALETRLEQLTRQTPEDRPRGWARFSLSSRKKEREVRLSRTAATLPEPSRRAATPWGAFGRYFRGRKEKRKMRRDKRRDADGSESHDTLGAQ